MKKIVSKFMRDRKQSRVGPVDANSGTEHGLDTSRSTIAFSSEVDAGSLKENALK
jgi:hypothetical protein